MAVYVQEHAIASMLLPNAVTECSSRGYRCKKGMQQGLPHRVQTYIAAVTCMHACINMQADFAADNDI